MLLKAGTNIGHFFVKAFPIIKDLLHVLGRW